MFHLKILSLEKKKTNPKQFKTAQQVVVSEKDGGLTALNTLTCRSPEGTLVNVACLV